MSILKVKDLKVHFPIKGGIFGRTVDYVKAVDGVSFSIEKGMTYGLVGESGSGKTTTGRAIIGLNKITSGNVLFEGKDITSYRRAKADYYKDVQMIFQDPYSSLNPRKRVLDIVAEPLRNFEKLSRQEEKKRVQELLELVGLSPESILKYPHQFSGGQRQRIGIARAIALKPKLIIADEPVSALDVSVQAQVLNFMQDIQKELDLTYLFISHDLGVIRHMCNRIGIMYKGRYVEEGTTEDIFNNPQHIYTKRLVAAIPDIDPNKRKEHAKFRQEVQREYEQSFNDYFDENGLAYDLQSISDTHLVALPKKG
ncbi:peptide/nickel transport system ATP-binding protein [Cerasibacillus quisquiliarum]|uniref:Peptide ABC transporter ATP-binding protein n=1 Tax=Cerasibacillus quisquiliarum TaxID=227865 RepID=A0A511UVZ7_9BACI|nr:ATP-binding cassette domain-containing protein [Cerasibacillus quisquiliarum]MBB5146057.1 peptide/nickel transport system ATP-binding protein [Cerasibacillus quisquiliarum]GEN30789.1 peptide ABC transporter ATP-binding protein [Cerasibacillus quisquiliarum]